jgi:hypothetical protein
MVLLRLAGAHEHTINMYRTITPKKMSKFLPEMKEITRRLNAGDPHAEGFNPNEENPTPFGWDSV